jgi:flagellar basal body-associated protein FliL
MTDKKKKKNIYITISVTIVISILIAFGAFIYNKYYQETYQFQGLGEVYKSRQQQFKRYNERKLTFGNKANPPKTKVKKFPSYKVRFATNLSDGAYLTLSLDFRFSNEEGIEEIRRKWERISFASSLALSPYSGEELNKGSRDEVLVIIENQIMKRVFSKIEYIYLDNFHLRN